MANLRLILTLLTLAVAGSIFAPGAVAATYPAAHDSWVTNRYQARNYGAERVMRASDSPIKRAYVRFTVPAISGTIQSAYLRVYSQSAAARGFRVWTTTAGWNESGITWANAPAAARVAAPIRTVRRDERRCRRHAGVPARHAGHAGRHRLHHE